jgi:hypothetical protein
MTLIFGFIRVNSFYSELREGVGMRKIEVAIIGVIFGAIPALVGFLGGWWISVPLVPEDKVWLGALAGLIAGLLLDAIFLNTAIQHAYTMKIWLWGAVYLFYSVGVFGFFMGMPVFNVLLALPAGFLLGGRLAYGKADASKVEKTTKASAAFTTGVLAVACAASAALALMSPSTAADLQGMLNLPFRVTSGMIAGLILGGGIVILALEWWLTVRSVKTAYRILSGQR